MVASAVFSANLFLAYAFLGVFFAIYFVRVGAARLDAGVTGSPLGFRIWRGVRSHKRELRQ